MSQTHHKVIIIGAGSAGLCTAYHLQKRGIDDFMLLEKAEGLGGTWFWNQYPGAECDVQSHLYSFSFEPNPNWSRPFAGQEEILEYFNHIADKYDIRDPVNLDHLADMVSAVVEGGIVMARAVNEPMVTAEQILLLRSYVRLLFKPAL